MNVPFITYRPETGEIFSHGWCASDIVKFQAFPGLLAMQADDPMQTSKTHYVADGKVAAYTPEELARKEAVPVGWHWKLPERVAEDRRTLAEAKEQKLREFAARTDSTLAPLTAGYPDSELQSWAKQETEARAFTANSAANVPLLNALARGRGISTADLAARILRKSDAFATYSGGIIGNRQRREDQVAAAQNNAEVDAINWS